MRGSALKHENHAGEGGADDLNREQPRTRIDVCARGLGKSAKHGQYQKRC